jgi:hypothetical protein
MDYAQQLRRSHLVRQRELIWEGQKYEAMPGGIIKVEDLL